MDRTYGHVYMYDLQLSSLRKMGHQNNDAFVVAMVRRAARVAEADNAAPAERKADEAATPPAADIAGSAPKTETPGMATCDLCPLTPV